MSSDYHLVMARDDFDSKTKEILAKRVGMKCSNPECGRGTVGPQENASKSVNVGVAAHITAASAGGKRFDPSLTSDARCSISNGIWLCQTCGKLVDDDELRFTVDTLRSWKVRAEHAASASIVAAPSVGIEREVPSVRIHISPTRNGWQQLAHFQLFNPGPRPILIKAWFSKWGTGVGSIGNESIVTVDKGWLPKRLDDQDAFDFIVDVGKHAIETLDQIGVVDGNGKRWSATPEEISSFIATAVAFRPRAEKPMPKAPEVDPAYIDISVERSHSPTNANVLEIVFLNRSSVVIPLRGAEIRWKYNPPRGKTTQPGKPVVMETEGSISVGSPRVLVNPNSAHRFLVAKDFSPILVATLASDVADGDIEVVVASIGHAWMEKGPQISKVIREHAQAIVDSWDT